MLSSLLDRNYLHLYQAKFHKLTAAPRGLKITINKPSTALKQCLVISFTYIKVMDILFSQFLLVVVRISKDYSCSQKAGLI